MASTSAVEQYVSCLLAGDRAACRRLIDNCLAATPDPASVYYDLLWPVMEQLERLYRADRIDTATEHLATRIHRSLADQVQLSLPRAEAHGRRIVIICADGEAEELGAQMCADLFEGRGWNVRFLGGGVPNDEILSLLGRFRPDVLLVFGTKPSGVPGVRRLVDSIREIGVNPTMNIIASGGVFNRADGLWKEVNADLTAKSAYEVIPAAETAPPRTPTVTRPGAPKKRRRRRSALLTAPAR